MNRFFYTATSMGAKFGCFIGVFYGLRSGSLAVGVVSAVSVGVPFGVVMGAFVCLADRLTLKKGSPSSAIAVEQSRSVCVAADPALLEARLEQVLQSLKARRRAPASSGVIEADVPWSWKSFGERLTVSMTPTNDGLVNIDVTSRPRLRTTTVDYGKNFDNVQRVCEGLLAMDEAAPTQSA